MEESQTAKEIHFRERIVISNEKAYDEVASYLGHLASSKKLVDGKFLYYFDGGGIIRTTQDNGTLELTDKVDREIRNCIMDIIKTEKRDV